MTYKELVESKNRLFGEQNDAYRRLFKARTNLAKDESEANKQELKSALNNYNNITQNRKKADKEVSEYEKKWL